VAYLDVKRHLQPKRIPVLMHEAKLSPDNRILAILVYL
jgi:hypothetical protein